MARDRRVSVTDRCNLRCTYCMPAEGLPWRPTAEMLTDEVVGRLGDLTALYGREPVVSSGGN